MWVLALFVSNLAIMWLEYTYRIGHFNSFISALPSIALPILIGQAGLFYGYKYAPSLLIAGAVFSLVNVSLRVVNVQILGETMNTYTLLGISFLLVSIILFKIQ